jgi:hypothetical protein
LTIDEMTELGRGERRRLKQLEATIARSVQSFQDAGRALIEIRDSRLYRENHTTFEDYCREDLDLTRKRAYDFIAAAEVVDALSPNGDTPVPATEWVARELAPLRGEPDQLVQVWDAAQAAAAEQERAVTALDVRHARQAVVPEPAAALRLAPPPAADPSDTRFQAIEDAVSLLQVLPDIEECPFPVDEGDIEAIGEAVAWLVEWTPRLSRAWKAHVAATRRRAA